MKQNKKTKVCSVSGQPSKTS